MARWLVRCADLHAADFLEPLNATSMWCTHVRKYAHATCIPTRNTSKHTVLARAWCAMASHCINLQGETHGHLAPSLLLPPPPPAARPPADNALWHVPPPPGNWHGTRCISLLSQKRNITWGNLRCLCVVFQKLSTAVHKVILVLKCHIAERLNIPIWWYMYVPRACRKDQESQCNAMQE